MSGFHSYVFVAAALAGACGCFHPNLRLQGADDREKDKHVELVRDVADVGNVMPQQLSGVGLVENLDGTGDSPAGEFRKMLEVQLRKQKTENIKSLLDSPNNALVLVTAFIPPGARKGDALDIQVTLPEGSKATSLKGGYLRECVLRNYEAASNLNPKYANSQSIFQGHILGKAKGPLLVGLGNPGEPAELRRGRIWEGGVTLIDRPFYLLLKNDRKSASVANVVAQRINLMFQDDVQKQLQVLKQRHLLLLKEVTDEINDKFSVAAPSRDTARAARPDLVAVRVPYAYRLNQERYLRVALLVPLREAPEHRIAYRQRLKDLLEDPKETVRGALRLEALGKESAPALKDALKHDHPLVRFCAAESLAYLGSTSGAEELAICAERHPELRAYALTALASLDENICRQKLTDLLSLDDAELRYGAFRALRLQGLRDNFGEEKMPTFTVHQVAPRATPLVHASVQKRAEIVFFGEPIQLVPPLRILAGTEFTITADSGDERCTIKRIMVEQASEQLKQCSLHLEDVLRTLTEMGGQYPEAIDLLRKLEERHCLSCPVRFNALPDAPTVEELAERARTDPSFLR